MNEDGREDLARDWWRMMCKGRVVFKMQEAVFLIQLMNVLNGDMDERNKWLRASTFRRSS